MSIVHLSLLFQVLINVSLKIKIKFLYFLLNLFNILIIFHELLSNIGLQYTYTCIIQYISHYRYIEIVYTVYFSPNKWNH